MEINIGVNIGQVTAYTTFAVVVWERRDYYFIRLLERSLFGENVMEMGIRLTQIGESVELYGDKVNLVRINLSGIGSPLIDLVLRNCNLIKKDHLELVYLSGGAKPRKDDDDLILPKELMISRLKILKQLNQVRYDHKLMIKTYNGDNIPVGNLFNELQIYETKVCIDESIWNPEKKIGEYDDVAVALGLACWDHHSQEMIRST